MCWIWSAGGVVVVVLLLVLPHMELATELVNGLLLTGPRVESTTAAAALVMVGCWGRSPAESMVVMLLVEQVERFLRGERVEKLGMTSLRTVG